jgi:hypothetical protein
VKILLFLSNTKSGAICRNAKKGFEPPRKIFSPLPPTETNQLKKRGQYI